MEDNNINNQTKNLYHEKFKTTILKDYNITILYAKISLIISLITTFYILQLQFHLLQHNVINRNLCLII